MKTVKPQWKQTEKQQNWIKESKNIYYNSFELGLVYHRLHVILLRNYSGNSIVLELTLFQSLSSVLPSMNDKISA